jgi:hypothetical protein
VARGVLTQTVADGGRLALRLQYRPQPPSAADTDVGVLATGRVALTPLTLPYASSVDAAWQQELLSRLRNGTAAFTAAEPGPA